MPMKQTGRKVYKSMQGKQIDMDLLRQRNELTPAVGNAKVNARGDQLGPGGKIIRKKEEVIKDYYRNNPNTMPDENPVKKDISSESQTAQESQHQTSSKKTTRAQQKLSAEQEEWFEDEDGYWWYREEGQADWQPYDDE